MSGVLAPGVWGRGLATAALAQQIGQLRNQAGGIASQARVAPTQLGDHQIDAALGQTAYVGDAVLEIGTPGSQGTEILGGLFGQPGHVARQKIDNTPMQAKPYFHDCLGIEWPAALSTVEHVR